MMLPEVIQINGHRDRKVSTGLIVGWIIFALVFWTLFHAAFSPLLPTPVEVLNAAGVQWQQGAVTEMVQSIGVSLSAILCALVIALGLSYLSTIPFFNAPVEFIGSLRVLSLTGITIIFVLATPNGYWLKVSILTFAIVVFLVNSMLQVIADIPSSRYDYARTLGLNHWQVLREVVIYGTLPSAFDSLRMNAAMAWMMLTVVESMSRSGGGIGILLNELSRANNYAAIFAIQMLILVVGLGQDALIRLTKSVVCPYTKA